VIYSLDASAVLASLLIRIRTYRDAHAKEKAKLRPLTKSLGLSPGHGACIAQATMNDLPILTVDRRMAKAGKISGVSIELIC
jgi:PIN domain nuclease of toxin-antitoxin system